MTLPGSTIVANGLRHHVVIEGDGTPVVLLHGFPDTSYVWRHQIDALARAGFRVIAPDLRGMGDSEKPEDVGSYGLSNHIRDVGAIMDTLGIARAHIVGHDWGAGLAWALATFVPERVDRLAVLSVGRWGARRRSLEQLARAWYMFAFQFDEALETFRRDDWAVLRAWAGPHADVEHTIGHLSEPGALRAAVNIYRANATPAFLFADGVALPKVRADTLGIWGAGDPYLTEEQMIASAEDVAGSWRYERIDDAGHWLMLEVPGRITDLLRGFLAG